MSHNFLPLEMTAAKGSTSVQVASRVTWAVAEEIVISPTDYGAHLAFPPRNLYARIESAATGCWRFEIMQQRERFVCVTHLYLSMPCVAGVTDMHAAEVRTITRVTRTDTGKSIISFAEPLRHSHYSALEAHGARSISMRAHVGLLTRNIVIKGEGQGEDQTYHSWNLQNPSASATARCGNGYCEVGENSLTCGDCVGPAHEFGASILVGGYEEEYTVCDAYLQCQDGYRREFAGSMQLDNVELRYFGQNNLRAGLELVNLGHKGANVSVTNVAMNRGYFRGIDIQNSDGANIDSNLLFRSHLPAVRVMGGRDNVITNNLATVGIFWGTHRGAIQGPGLAMPKLNAMIGMFHDQGVATILHHNIAAGSERAGFSGSGVACGDTTSFVGNVAHSSLAGYWFDHYRTPKLYTCVQLTDFTAFKIWEYGIYSEVFLPYINVIGAKVADATVGVSLHLSGAASLEHTILDAKVSIRDSLLVGQSGNGHCSTTKPSLSSCKFYMAWCHHLPKHHVGIHISAFQGGSNSAPKIKPWWDAGSYPALYGYTEIEEVTFAGFGVPCSQGPRANLRDFALSGIPDKNADVWPPVHTKSIQKVEVAEESVVFFPEPKADWINQVSLVWCT